jgi:hypothetical protein
MGKADDRIWRDIKDRTPDLLLSMILDFSIDAQNRSALMEIVEDRIKKLQ